MTEQNKFQPIDTAHIYGDGIGHVTLYDASHANESEGQRIWTVTTIASLAYGNEEAKNPEALYERMKSIKHESLWEFIRDAYNGYSIVDSMRIDTVPYTEYVNKYTCNVEGHKQNIACFRIKVPIFVARQFMRHRSFSYLEMSRRYTKDTKVPFEFYSPKHNDYNILCGISTYYESCIDMYEESVKLGFQTQVASRFLPQTTYTEFYMMGEVEGLKNFFTLRCAKEAQEEIREVAMAMLKLIAMHQPELYQKVLP